MKHIRTHRYILAALLLCLSLPAAAQTEVEEYRPGVTAEGITYFLPQTRLRIALTVMRTHHTPGEFARYAQRYMRLADAPQSEYDEWQIQSVSITPYGVADKTKAYSIKHNFKTSAPLVRLASDCRLLSVNSADFEADPQLPVPSVTPVKNSRPAADNYKTEEILSAGSQAKMAELTANEIYDIRENRSLLTKGQADFMPKDGEQLKLMLANLDEQEEALMQTFRGTETQEVHVLVYDIQADKGIERRLLLNFSKYLGAVDNDDPAGSPVYISLTPADQLAVIEPEADGKKKKEPNDLRYLIPGTATVKVFTADRELASKEVAMAQLGRTEHLGGELFNKKYTTRVILSPVTGGIVRIEADKPE